MKSMLSANRAIVARNSAQFGTEFVQVPLSLCPQMTPMPERVYRNRDFLVQVYARERGAQRITICRTKLRRDGDYEDGISWDELQEIKSKMGFGDRDAVEVYPPERDVANVANMRHLWVLDYRLDFAWRH